MILGKDYQEPYPGNTLCKLDEVPVMQEGPHILFKAFVVQLGSAGAPAVLDIPCVFVPDNPAMGLGHAGDCRVTLGKDDVLARVICGAACRVDPADTDRIVFQRNTLASSEPPRTMTAGTSPRTSRFSVLFTSSSLREISLPMIWTLGIGEEAKVADDGLKSPGHQRIFPDRVDPFDVGAPSPASFLMTPILRSLSRCFLVFS